MERKIKFRAKSLNAKNKNEWVYGVPCENEHGEWQMFKKHERIYSIDHKSIGQYTGLKDKNGVDIYEGDILGWESYEGKKHQTRWIVEYNNERGFKSWSSTKNDEVVLGNIYENPELIK